MGIETSLINLITIFKYQTGDGLVDGTECSVCLNEFQDDDSLKLLPKCNHAFHIDCIDMWLRSHVNCPLCRAPIISNTVVAPVGSSIIVPISSTNDDIGSIVEMNNNNEAREGEFQENDDHDERHETSKKDVEILQKMRSSGRDFLTATDDSHEQFEYREKEKKSAKSGDDDISLFSS
ncbi:hypothetical protein MTR67_050549 [Solanum verrucosum]|uniref:RING-type E3 ubiquitin transferase n=1 Tax=Solanum verrucosum TaxID=315347 RepID=A0AAF0V4Q4_SOLVR|nr:hypothetical protein MTR67_050549 [Solanum verrucosum]